MLKQRLIGAAVLVALAVIFIPMVLEKPNPTVPDMGAVPQEDALPHGGELRDLDVGESQTLKLPPISAVSDQEAAAFANVAPAAGTAAPEPAAQADTGEPSTQEEPPEDETGASVEATTPAAPADAQSTAAAAKPAPAEKAAPPTQVAKAESAAAPSGNWVIQVGSFGNQSNATALRDKLRADGYTTQVERVALGSGETFRVRVGPYLDKAAAEETAAKLGKSHGLTPRVMSYP